jgi:hypothetical protein
VWAALAVSGIWLAALASMAIWASNPVMLNREQVLGALQRGVVVRARVIDLETGRCAALQQWPPDTVGDSFDVANLNQTETRPGKSYLLPLLRTEDGYVVAPSPGGQPLVYPDTDEALAQLEELLATQRSAQMGVSHAH